MERLLSKGAPKLQTLQVRGLYVQGSGFKWNTQCQRSTFLAGAIDFCDCALPRQMHLRFELRVRGWHPAMLYTSSPGAQVALDYERHCADRFHHSQHLWDILALSGSLRNLKLIFLYYEEQDFDQRV